MRVLHLGKYYPPVQGGIETVTFQVVEGLTRKGIVSDVLCFNPGGPTDRETWPAGYEVVRARTPRVVCSTPVSWDFINILKEKAPSYDILHLHCPNPMGALALRLVNPKAKIVLHWHSDVIRQKAFNKVYRILLGNWLARRADAVIGATDAHISCSEYSTEFRGKSHTIPFCLDPEPYAEEKADSRALDLLRKAYPGKKGVFALGRLISYKGFDVLVEAAGMLPEDWVVLIGGSGPLEGELKRRIQENGLEGKVALLGKVPQSALSAHYYFSRVFCLPSVTRAEMYGMVQLEAMACGRPVVSTRIPGSGVPLVNENGVTGLVVEPGNAAELARAIIEIDRDQQGWERMSANGLRASRTRFSPGAMVEAMAALYESLVSAQ